MNTLSVVHDVLRRQVREGDFCIDATAGKGRDTALLCRLTGENGRVLAFDVQEDAVRQTRELLAKEHLSAEVYLDSHANMAHYAEPETGGLHRVQFRPSARRRPDKIHHRRNFTACC